MEQSEKDRRDRRERVALAVLTGLVTHHGGLGTVFGSYTAEAAAEDAERAADAIVAAWDKEGQ